MLSIQQEGSGIVDIASSPCRQLNLDDQPIVEKGTNCPRVGKPLLELGKTRHLSVGSIKTVETEEITLKTLASSCNFTYENDVDFEMSSNTSSDDEFRFVIDNPPIVAIEPTSGRPLTPIVDEGIDLHNDVGSTTSVPCILPSNRPRLSLLKPFQFDSTRIRNTGWKNLPKVDIDAITTLNNRMNMIREKEVEAFAAARIALSANVETTTTKKKKKKQLVKFGYICVRNYNQTIGDNPSVSYGTPISLDWEYEEFGMTILIDDYEMSRPHRRTARQMMLNYYQRRNILQYWYGYPVAQIDAAEKQANGAKFHRSITKALLPYSIVEDVLTSAVRKAKRRLKTSKSNNDRHWSDCNDESCDKSRLTSIKTVTTQNSSITVIQSSIVTRQEVIDNTSSIVSISNHEQQLNAGDVLTEKTHPEDAVDALSCDNLLEC